MTTLAMEGTLELELSPRPLALAGHFHLAADTAERPARWTLLLLIAGIVLVLPGALVLAGSILEQFLRIAWLYDIAMAMPAIIPALSLFVGAPLALLLNILPIVPLALVRQDGKISAGLTVTPNLVQLLLIVVALGVAGVFFGHLVADGLACFRGIKSAC